MFGERLLEIRNDHGYTQGAFAWAIGVSKSHISRLEAGKTKPSKLFIQSVCREFGVSEDWLVNGVGRKYAKDSIIHVEDMKTAWRSSTAYIYKYAYIAKALSPSCNLDRAIWFIFNDWQFVSLLNYLIHLKIEIESKTGNDLTAASRYMYDQFEIAYPEYRNFFDNFGFMLNDEHEKNIEELSQYAIWDDVEKIRHCIIDDPSIEGAAKGMQLENKLLDHRIYSLQHTEKNEPMPESEK